MTPTQIAARIRALYQELETALPTTVPATAQQILADLATAHVAATAAAAPGPATTRPAVTPRRGATIVLDSPAGYRIPPPPDPVERARWEKGVAARLAVGERYVGDGPYKPTR